MQPVRAESGPNPGSPPASITDVQTTNRENYPGFIT